MPNDILTLYELNTLIHEVINYSFSDTYWVKAEIAKVNENYSGHCYLELVEKSGTQDVLIAQGRAIIWRNIYRNILPHFRKITGHELEIGMNILFRAKVEYHPVYGLNLHIFEIDPNYTLGELVSRKMQIIHLLKQEGIFEMNRQQPFPLIPQRIAVISSETAAGYNDFIKHLTENSYNYKFFVKLFQATMQGKKAETSIIKALDKINQNISLYDVVVIIRGGGSQADLSCFDSYLLSSHVAQFPIPVLTGIGHEQDESVVDLVAYQQLKTPTAVADYIIQKVFNFEMYLTELLNNALKHVRVLLNNEYEKLKNLSIQAPSKIKQIILNQKYHLNILQLNTLNFSLKYLKKHQQEIEILLLKVYHLIDKKFSMQHQWLKQILIVVTQSLYNCLQQHRGKLNLLLAKATLSDPKHILQKGYSITLYKDKPVTQVDQLNIDDEIKTYLYRGSLRSKIIEKNE